MDCNLRKGLLFTAIGIILFGFVAPGMAADFPTRPVTLIVPWSAGGVTDVVLRVLAETTGKHLGQPVIVENRSGGGGTVGPATMAANAKPDGYTIGQIPLAVFRFPYMMKTTWNALKDFTYIIHITGYTFGTVVKADSPWKTWNEFVAYAKANPNKVTYSNSGAGTTPHITMERFALQEGIKWISVPSKGGGEAVAALLGGHVTAMGDSTEWGPHVDSGALRLLVTWGLQRTKRWPTVPTLKELGYGIVSNSPWGFAGPKGMDPKVVKILHDAFKKGFEEPAFQQILTKFDMEPYYLNTEDYVRLAAQLDKEEKDIVEKLGLKQK